MAKLGPSSIVETDEILNDLQNSLVKEFGENAAMRLSSQDTLSRVDFWVSSRSIVVDKVLAGGRAFPCSLVPFGRQMEISGPPGAGKTSLCAHIAAEVQSKGGIVIVTDTEERIDHPYWKSLGVDTSRIINLTAETLESVFDKQVVAIQHIKKRAPEVPVLMLWDSVGGTSMNAIVDFEDNKEGLSPMEIAKKQMMSKARIISAGMELINTHISKTRVAYIYTNHLYTKPNVTFGDPQETPGGNKLKYFATVRLRLTPIGEIKEEDALTGGKKIIGHKVLVKALKNSMAPIKVEMEGAVLGGLGFCNAWTVRETAETLKLITKKGAWSYCKIDNDEISFQGWNGFLEKVVTHPKYAELEMKVIEALQ